MIRTAVAVATLLALAGCSVLSPAPARFPEFVERQIAGPGNYNLPQWSPDSRYLAFLYENFYWTLSVYDTQTNTSWDIIANIYTGHFAWKPDGTLTYLKYSDEHNTSPYPRIFDLYQVDIHDRNDILIAENLSSVKDFEWFQDDQRLAILMDGPNTSYGSNNAIYVLNVPNGETTLVIEAEDLDVDYFLTLSLKPDEKSLLIAGIDADMEELTGQYITYNLENRLVSDRFFDSQIIPSEPVPYLWPVVGSATSDTWVKESWFLAKINTPNGECYNYALFFFNLRNLSNSFCIPTIVGIVSEPTISPDLSKISYVTVADPGRTYVMMADVPAALSERLKRDGE